MPLHISTKPTGFICRLRNRLRKMYWPNSMQLTHEGEQELTAGFNQTFKFVGKAAKALGVKI